MTDRSADVYELLRQANEAKRDDVAIGYLIRAVEALAVMLESHGHSYAAAFGPGGQWDNNGWASNGTMSDPQRMKCPMCLRAYVLDTEGGWRCPQCGSNDVSSGARDELLNGPWGGGGDD